MITIELGKTYVVVSAKGIATAVITAASVREVQLLERIQLLSVSIYERPSLKVRFARGSAR